MSPTFYFKDGDLFYRDWNYGRDALARTRIERQAMQFESYADAFGDELADQCRQALADYDTFYTTEIADVHA
jgi:hypothetical protein